LIGNGCRSTLKQLRYFDAAVPQRLYSKPAAEMNISHRSITASIDAMEQRSASELFRAYQPRACSRPKAGQYRGPPRVAEFMNRQRVF